MGDSGWVGAASDPEGFSHVRVVIGLVTGLSVTRMLNGLARFVQHPSRTRIYPPHLAWALFLLLYVIHFWWFEFGLQAIPRWEFQEYLFVIGYAATIFLASSLLFPDRMDEYSGFAEYFHSRQRWFYGLLATIFAVDVIDSAIKGAEHLAALGPAYLVRQAVLVGLALVGMGVADRRYHLWLPVAAILAEVWWIASQFEFLD